MNEHKRDFTGTVAIIGGGPAGLTTALELLRRSTYRPVVFEASDEFGGISRTINYKGNRIDIGGHRFFSKSDRVMEWWLDIFPIQKAGQAGSKLDITYQGKSRSIEMQDGPDPDEVDNVFLVRDRSSRIFHNRNFFSYPISLSWDTISNLGILRTMRIGFSYMKSVVFPIRPETTLEEFYINRFGRELYNTFFRDYTEKVWGIECSEISAEWGAQRVKGLSISKSIVHFFRSRFKKKSGLEQKDVETSLIEHFLYPKYGPGQMWEEVARQIVELGGEIRTECKVDSILMDGNRLSGVKATDRTTGESITQPADYVVSSMPVQDLVRCMGVEPPKEVTRVSEGLIYRDFITVGILATGMKAKHNGMDPSSLLSDTWIYVQEGDVNVGRIQVFNNWSPYMIENPDNVWLGLEFFCTEGDDLWTLPDEDMKSLGIKELAQLGFVDAEAVLDSVVIRQPKAYPAYFGSYDEFSVIREFIDTFDNLYLVGRNGLHKYNNQDHSMLTAMMTVDSIADGSATKEDIWNSNVEQEYHEKK